MKKICTLLVLILSVAVSFAQNNIGIGTTNPHASALLDITSNTKGLLIPRMTTAERTAIASPAKGLMVFDNTTSSFWFYSGTAWAEMNGAGGGATAWTTDVNNIYNTNSGNTGIGTNAPGFKLDVNGRMRLRHANSQSAGFWVDGSANTLIGFIGAFNNNTIGLYGAGAGWGVIMNTETGNTGIGTAAPTAKLDINGSLRIRQSGAAAGSTLHAADASGNAAWVAPVAFKVNGYSFGQNIIFPPNTWQDINFGSNTSYNYGLGYSSATSEFTASQNGLYNFKSSLYFTTTASRFQQRLRLRRNGIVSTIAAKDFENGINDQTLNYSSYLETEVVLNAGDDVWIEANGNSYGGGDVYISGSSVNTWFSGRMLFPL